MLVWRFVEEFSKAFGKRIESITKDNMEMLQRYAWPGNVRELRNLVERAVIGANGPRLTIALPQRFRRRRATQRQAGRRGEGAHQGRARQHQVADSRRRRRRRSAGAQSHDPRDAHGEAGAPAPAPLTPAFRAPSAIRGNPRRPAESAAHPSIGDNSKLHRSIGLPSLPAPAWYVCCSLPARGAPSCCAGRAGARHTATRSCLAIPGLAHPHRAGLPRVPGVDRGHRRVHGALRGGVGNRGGDAPACPFGAVYAVARSARVRTRATQRPVRFRHRKRAAWTTSRRCATGMAGTRESILAASWDDHTCRAADVPTHCRGGPASAGDLRRGTDQPTACRTPPRCRDWTASGRQAGRRLRLTRLPRPG